MFSISEKVKYIDIALIYELWNEYAAAINDGDLDRWLALWTNEGVQMAPDEPPRAGKEQIMEAMQQSFARFNTRKMIINAEEVQIFGNRAYAYGTYTFERIGKERGEKKSYSGKFLDILAKQAGGSWQIVIDCHNYNESY